MNLKESFRSCLISVFSGLLAGLAAAIFLYLLDIATNVRNQNPLIIWGLPFAGLLIGWIYWRFGKDSNRGHNLILDEIHDPQNVLPLQMAPLVLMGTLITHLFGGSAGREGTAVQMGATLSDQLSKFFKLDAAGRKTLLVTGAGAGFAAAIGAPWAGVIFGMEVIQVGELKIFAALECLIASFVAYYTTIFLKAPHSQFPFLEMGPFEVKTFFYIAVAGLVFGLAARIFILFTHLIETICEKFIRFHPLRPFFGGIILVVLFYFEGSYRYAGLGIPFIQESLNQVSHAVDPLLKLFFTGLTIGAGFKGGEFIPLVFIGSTLGSALSIIIPVSFKLLAAVGFAAVFAGASNTPIACSIMAMEIFGIGIAPYALMGCFVSYFVSGKKGLYKSQKNLEKKFL